MQRVAARHFEEVFRQLSPEYLLVAQRQARSIQRRDNLTPRHASRLVPNLPYDRNEKRLECERQVSLRKENAPPLLNISKAAREHYVDLRSFVAVDHHRTEITDVAQRTIVKGQPGLARPGGAFQKQNQRHAATKM